MKKGLGIGLAVLVAIFVTLRLSKTQPHSRLFVANNRPDWPWEAQGKFLNNK